MRKSVSYKAIQMEEFQSHNELTSHDTNILEVLLEGQMCSRWLMSDFCLEFEIAFLRQE